MKFFFSDLFEKKQANHQDIQSAVEVPETLHNITDGSECFDDAIRMKDQPFMYSYTEETIAAGSPKELW